MRFDLRFLYLSNDVNYIHIRKNLFVCLCVCVRACVRACVVFAKVHSNILSKTTGPNFLWKFVFPVEICQDRGIKFIQITKVIYLFIFIVKLLCGPGGGVVGELFDI